MQFGAYRAFGRSTNGYCLSLGMMSSLISVAARCAPCEASWVWCFSENSPEAPFAHLAPLVNRDKTQPRTANPNRPGGLGPGVVGTRRHPGSGRPTRHARPGVAGNPARPGIGTGEGLGMLEPRRGGLGGCGIVRYTYELLARTLVHVIWISIA